MRHRRFNSRFRIAYMHRCRRQKGIRGFSFSRWLTRRWMAPGAYRAWMRLQHERDMRRHDLRCLYR